MRTEQFAQSTEIGTPIVRAETLLCDQNEK